MNPFELEINRRNTAAFIAADPVALPLLRGERVRTGSGGYRDVVPTEPNVGAQVFRLIPANDRTPEVRTSFGRLVVPTYTLLAEWDADLVRYDRFDLHGIRYECANVRMVPVGDQAYEAKADVVVWENS